MRRSGAGASDADSPDSGPPSSDGEGGASPGASPGRKPLRTLLRNFLNRVDGLEARKNEGDDTYDGEFQRLKAFSDSLRGRADFSCRHGEVEVNRKKNRYKDILPFDASRVCLSEYPGVPGSDYINANYVKGASGSNAYIAAQGPLPHTVNDFWRMVVEADVQVIVMACNETEAGKHKCERYWSEPGDEGSDGDYSEKQFGKFFVKTLKMREICPDFLVRTMRLRWTPDGSSKEEERTVCQFHYTAWPDHGIPTQVKPLLEMVRLIRDCQASETLPVLVHCSAGCGRTGTICAIDFIWGLLRTGKLTADFSLFELVKDMRRQRIAMVQTVEQYILVHRAVRELFLEQLRVIDSHPYENIDDEGNPLCRNPDEIVPDYETIFIKDAEDVQDDIDRILAHKMSQLPRTLMGTAMLGKSHTGSGSSSNSNVSNAGSRSEECLLSSSAPNPPPKQRNLLDSTALENKRLLELTKSDSEFSPVEEFTRKSEPVLFEPSRPQCKEGAVQRFRKGNLRLKQADNGAWKLEELGDRPENKNDSKKKKSKEDNAESKTDMLLRRPSIKRIRAFFNKDKATASKVSEKGDLASKHAPESDLVAAFSKLPKFETNESNDEPLANGLTSSVSVPNSLDRHGALNEGPDYANLRRANSPHKQNRRSERGGSMSKDLSPMRTSQKSLLRTSVSIERLDSPLTITGESNNNTRPSLPVKRSKSMKTPAKPATVISQTEDFGNQFATNEQLRHNPCSTEDLEEPRSLPTASVSNSTYLSPRSRALLKTGGVLPKTPSTEPGLPPSKPKRQMQQIGSSPEYANVRLDQATDFAMRRASDGAAIDGMTAFHSKRGSLPDEKIRDTFLEQQLAKLHARILSVNHPEDDPSIPQELKKSLPLIARSSNSLDEESKKMLRDCQEYLMTSFRAAEKESTRLLIRRPLKNRSAESSPMTTLQKSSAYQLPSSHSSPSNSYNKYCSKVSSPPGTIRKSTTSVAGSVQKNYCSPADSIPSLYARGAPEGSSGRLVPSAASSTKISPLAASAKTPKAKKDAEDMSYYRDYANVEMTKEGVLGDATAAVLEAQRKVSASSASNKGLASKERRNSFREAVEQGKEDADARAKTAYESIWFEKGRRDDYERRSSSDQRQIHHHHHRSRGLHRHVEPAKTQTQSWQPQQNQKIPKVHGNYENVLDSGYEPVDFKDMSGKNAHTLAPHQLQSVGLVSEVVNRSQQQTRHSQAIPSVGRSAEQQLSNPPPYKEPPQPFKNANASDPRHPPQHQIGLESSSHARHKQSEYLDGTGSRHSSQRPRRGETEGVGNTVDKPSTYVNVHVTRRNTQDQGRAAKDDLILFRSKSKNRSNQRGRSAKSRYSLGDFSMFDHKTLPIKDNELAFGGLTVKPADSPETERASFHVSPSYLRPSSGSREAVGSLVRQSSPTSPVHRSIDTCTGASSPPGIDLDAVAAMMQNNPAHGSSSKMGRTLTGMLSGAAANIRHKFHHVNSFPDHLGSSATSPSVPRHPRQLQQQRQSSEGNLQAAATRGLAGEQSSRSIPLTVPGATFVDASKPQPYAYPYRLEARPRGPRETPTFKKKQEYL